MKRIPLRNRAGEVRAWTLVDDEDYERCNQQKWSLTSRGYAVGCGGTLPMARFILGLTKDDPREADHINRDPLDNRRENLRAASKSENQQNRECGYGVSSFRGVYLHAGKWCAQVTVNRRKHYLGRYDTQEEAAAIAAEFRAEHLPFSEDARARRSTPVVESDERKAA